MIPVCAVLTYEGKVCTSIPFLTMKDKYLCVHHRTLILRGEQVKWAPKRLLQWQLDRKIKEAVERADLNAINAEYYSKH
jgi:hypothetical protein